jgi:hypothetical protein
MKSELNWISVWDATPIVHSEAEIQKLLIKLDGDDLIYQAEFDPRWGWRMLTTANNHSHFIMVNSVLFWTYAESPTTQQTKQ